MIDMALRSNILSDEEASVILLLLGELVLVLLCETHLLVIGRCEYIFVLSFLSQLFWEDF